MRADVAGHVGAAGKRKTVGTLMTPG
jgi:hypothetical protein